MEVRSAAAEGLGGSEGMCQGEARAARGVAHVVSQRMASASDLGFLAQSPLQAGGREGTSCETESERAKTPAYSSQL